MPPLRQRVRRRRTGRILVAALLLFLLVDAALPPRYQVLANAAIFAVNGYQVLGRPLVRHVVVCRFHPSCSDYSKQAFAKYGFWRGAGLTIYRLSRCRPPMPMGTVDEP